MEFVQAWNSNYLKAAEIVNFVFLSSGIKNHPTEFYSKKYEVDSSTRHIVDCCGVAEL